MTMVGRELDLDPKRYPPRSLAAQISNLKNELVTPDAWAEQASTAPEKVLAEVYARYQRRLVEAHALDFDDLIMSTVGLLQNHPDVAEHYRRTFRHVLVDEYQDTNHAQYMLVRELTRSSGGRPPAELAVVGDADQSIYAFRGATIRNILEFERDYPDATTILLEQNYRSTQTILSAANAVIARNPDRKPKNLWSEAGHGEKIQGYVAENEHDEAAWVAQQIDGARDPRASRRPTSRSSTAPTRSRVCSRRCSSASALPYKVVGGVRFYERKEIRDALAYLRVIANPDDVVSLRRILNTPRRGIGDRAEAAVEAFADRERLAFGAALDVADTSIGLAPRSLNAIRDFVELLTSLRAVLASPDGTPSSILEAVLDQTGYLRELEASKDPQDEGRVDNLRELVIGRARVRGAARRHRRGQLARRVPRAGLAGRRRRLHPRRVRRDGHADDAAHGQGPRVPGGVPDRAGGGRVPAPAHARRPGRAGRGAPAGLRRHHPRAQRLYLSRALSRSAWGAPAWNQPSRFLDEIPAELAEWSGEVGREPFVASYGDDGGGSRYGDHGYRAGGRRSAQESLASSRLAGGGLRGGAGNRAVPALEIGDRVTHDAWGLGKVVATRGSGDGAQAQVDFGSSGTKWLMLRYAPLQKL